MTTIGLMHAMPRVGLRRRRSEAIGWLGMGESDVGVVFSPLFMTGEGGEGVLDSEGGGGCGKPHIGSFFANFDGMFYAVTVALPLLPLPPSSSFLALRNDKSASSVCITFSSVTARLCVSF